MSLRLAERQGLLAGRRLSPVQHYGGRLLNEVADIQARKNTTEQIKMAAVAGGFLAPSKAWPHLFTPPRDEEEVVDGAGGDFTSETATPDFAEVVWQTPSDMENPEALLEQLETFNNLTLVSDEEGLDEEGEWL